MDKLSGGEMTQSIFEQPEVLEQLFVELTHSYQTGQFASLAQLQRIAPSLNAAEYELLIERFTAHLREQMLKQLQDRTPAATTTAATAVAPAQVPASAQAPSPVSASAPVAQQFVSQAAAPLASSSSSAAAMLNPATLAAQQLMAASQLQQQSLFQVPAQTPAQPQFQQQAPMFANPAFAANAATTAATTAAMPTDIQAQLHVLEQEFMQSMGRFLVNREQELGNAATQQIKDLEDKCAALEAQITALTQEQSKLQADLALAEAQKQKVLDAYNTQRKVLAQMAVSEEAIAILRSALSIKNLSLLRSLSMEGEHSQEFCLLVSMLPAITRDNVLNLVSLALNIAQERTTPVSDEDDPLIAEIQGSSLGTAEAPQVQLQAQEQSQSQAVVEPVAAATEEAPAERPIESTAAAAPESLATNAATDLFALQSQFNAAGFSPESFAALHAALSNASAKAGDDASLGDNAGKPLDLSGIMAVSSGAYSKPEPTAASTSSVAPMAPVAPIASDALAEPVLPATNSPEVALDSAEYVPDQGQINAAMLAQMAALNDALAAQKAADAGRATRIVSGASATTKPNEEISAAQSIVRTLSTVSRGTTAISKTPTLSTVQTASTLGGSTVASTELSGTPVVMGVTVSSGDEASATKLFDDLEQICTAIFDDKDSPDVTSLDLENAVAQAIDSGVFASEDSMLCRRLVLKMMMLGRAEMSIADLRSKDEDIVNALKSEEQKQFARAVLNWGKTRTYLKKGAVDEDTAQHSTTTNIVASVPTTKTATPAAALAPESKEKDPHSINLTAISASKEQEAESAPASVMGRDTTAEASATASGSTTSVAGSETANKANKQPAILLNSVRPRALPRDEGTLVREMTQELGDDSIAAFAAASAKIESLAPLLHEAGKELNAVAAEAEEAVKEHAKNTSAASSLDAAKSGQGTAAIFSAPGSQPHNQATSSFSFASLEAQQQQAKSAAVAASAQAQKQEHQAATSEIASVAKDVLKVAHELERSFDEKDRLEKKSSLFNNSVFANTQSGTTVFGLDDNSSALTKAADSNTTESQGAAADANGVRSTKHNDEEDAATDFIGGPNQADALDDFITGNISDNSSFGSAKLDAIRAKIKAAQDSSAENAVNTNAATAVTAPAPESKSLSSALTVMLANDNVSTNADGSTALSQHTNIIVDQAHYDSSKFSGSTFASGANTTATTNGSGDSTRSFPRGTPEATAINNQQTAQALDGSLAASFTATGSTNIIKAAAEPLPAPVAATQVSAATTTTTTTIATVNTDNGNTSGEQGQAGNQNGGSKHYFLGDNYEIRDPNVVEEKTILSEHTSIVRSYNPERPYAKSDFVVGQKMSDSTAIISSTDPDVSAAATTTTATATATTNSADATQESKEPIDESVYKPQDEVVPSVADVLFTLAAANEPMDEESNSGDSNVADAPASMDATATATAAATTTDATETVSSTEPDSKAETTQDIAASVEAETVVDNADEVSSKTEDIQEAPAIESVSFEVADTTDTDSSTETEDISVSEDNAESVAPASEPVSFAVVEDDSSSDEADSDSTQETSTTSESVESTDTAVSTEQEAVAAPEVVETTESGDATTEAEGEASKEESTDTEAVAEPAVTLDTKDSTNSTDSVETAKTSNDVEVGAEAVATEDVSEAADAGTQEDVATAATATTNTSAKTEDAAEEVETNDETVATESKEVAEDTQDESESTETIATSEEVDAAEDTETVDEGTEDSAEEVETSEETVEETTEEESESVTEESAEVDFQDDESTDEESESLDESDEVDESSDSDDSDESEPEVDESHKERDSLSYEEKVRYKFLSDMVAVRINSRIRQLNQLFNGFGNQNNVKQVTVSDLGDYYKSIIDSFERDQLLSGSLKAALLEKMAQDLSQENLLSIENEDLFNPVKTVIPSFMMSSHVLGAPQISSGFVSMQAAPVDSNEADSESEDEPESEPVEAEAEYENEDTEYTESEDLEVSDSSEEEVAEPESEVDAEFDEASTDEDNAEVEADADAEVANDVESDVEEQQQTDETSEAEEEAETDSESESSSESSSSDADMESNESSAAKVVFSLEKDDVVEEQEQSSDAEVADDSVAPAAATDYESGDNASVLSNSHSVELPEQSPASPMEFMAVTSSDSDGAAASTDDSKAENTTAMSAESGPEVSVHNTEDEGSELSFNADSGTGAVVGVQEPHFELQDENACSTDMSASISFNTISDSTDSEEHSELDSSLKISLDEINAGGESDDGSSSSADSSEQDSNNRDSDSNSNGAEVPVTPASSYLGKDRDLPNTNNTEIQGTWHSDGKNREYATQLMHTDEENFGAKNNGSGLSSAYGKSSAMTFMFHDVPKPQLQNSNKTTGSGSASFARLAFSDPASSYGHSNTKVKVDTSGIKLATADMPKSNVSSGAGAATADKSHNLGQSQSKSQGQDQSQSLSSSNNSCGRSNSSGSMKSAPASAAKKEAKSAPHVKSTQVGENIFTLDLGAKSAAAAAAAAAAFEAQHPVPSIEPIKVSPMAKALANLHGVHEPSKLGVGAVNHQGGNAKNNTNGKSKPNKGSDKGIQWFGDKR